MGLCRGCALEFLIGENRMVAQANKNPMPSLKEMKFCLEESNTYSRGDLASGDERGSSMCDTRFR
jgi:hypothetical protein